MIVDHFSRRVIGTAVFKRPPTFRQVAAFLRRTMRNAGATPRYIISDQGQPFGCPRFKKWCRHRNIRPRFGAIGQHGSIAIIERLIRSMKAEGMRRLLIPLGQRMFLREVRWYSGWYNKHRPHTALVPFPERHYHFFERVPRLRFWQPCRPARSTAAYGAAVAPGEKVTQPFQKRH